MAERTRRTILGGLLAASTLHALGERHGAAGQGAAPDRRRIIVFDVNETLRDIGALAPQFEWVFGDAPRSEGPRPELNKSYLGKMQRISDC